MRMAKQEARQKTPRTGRVWAGAARFAKIGTSIWTLPGSPKLIEFTLKPQCNLCKAVLMVRSSSLAWLGPSTKESLEKTEPLADLVHGLGQVDLCVKVLQQGSRAPVLLTRRTPAAVPLVAPLGWTFSARYGSALSRRPPPFSGRSRAPKSKRDAPTSEP